LWGQEVQEIVATSEPEAAETELKYKYKEDVRKQHHIAAAPTRRQLSLGPIELPPTPDP